MDLLGKESDLAELSEVFEQSGWKSYERLMRLGRGSGEIAISGPREERNVTQAQEADETEILHLIEERFDLFSDQLPTLEEIRQSRENGQILAIREQNQIAALLLFETAGFTSTIRYWAVGRDFECRGFGSALLRSYFRIHGSVKRFLLWVNERNENAVQKYLHYGYEPDGLKDQILIRNFALA